MSAVDLDMLKGDKHMPRKQLIKRTWKYIKPELASFIVAIILLIVNVGVEISFARLIGWAVDYLDGKYDPNPVFSVVLGVGLGYFGIIVVSQIFTYLQTMILQKAGQRIVYRLRMEVFEHIENMSQNQFNEMPVGSLVTRVANYTTAMSELFTLILVNMLKNIMTIVVVFVVMMIMSWKLTLIMTGLLVVVFGVSYIFRKIITKLFRKERGQISDMNTFLNENVSGMKITQIFNQQKRKEEDFNSKNRELKRTHLKIISAFALYRPFVTFLYHIAMGLTFVGGIWFGLLPGTVVSFYLLLSRFFNPIQELADKLNGLEKANTASERLFNLLDVPSEVVDSEDSIEIDRFEGKIEFKNVWFAYEENEWILKDVSFTIEPKQTAAFVGATGSGKTTILGLIVRNYEIQKGQILIDGIDVKKIKVKSLRKAIGQMLQDVFLFTGTVRDNITLHDTEYSEQEIIDACNYVNATSFINKNPKGLDAEVIERGENYSQGQRQLLSFSRTVLHKPQILILDEATANIDTETESLIQESLEKMKSIGTMLVVAHRLSTIQKADKIIVLQHGEITEQGNHQELLKNRGYYYRLYKLQFQEK